MFFWWTSDHVDEMKGKGRNKRKQRRIFGFWLQLACSPRHCLRFLQTCNHIWEGFFMVCSFHKVHTHTHTQIHHSEPNYASHSTISMHYENIPITNAVVMSSVCWICPVAPGFCLFQEALLQLIVMEHMCPLSGARIFYCWPLKWHRLHGIIGL